MKKNIGRKIILGAVSAAMLLGVLSGCSGISKDEAIRADGGITSAPETGGLAESSTAADTAEPAEPVTVYAATGGSPKPFTFVDSSNQLTGHNIELVEAVFERLPQYKLVVEVTDFPSIFAGLDSDRYQIGVNNFAKNEKRKEKYLFTDPIFVNQYVAIFAKENALSENIETWADLGGLKTISQAGINITTALENYNTASPQNPISIEYSDEDLVLQLQDIEAGKYDFLLMDKPMFEYYQNEFNFNVTGISIGTAVAEELMEEPFSYLIVGKGNEQLTEDINKALREVIEGGISKEINQKWFGSDYSPSY